MRIGAAIAALLGISSLLLSAGTAGARTYGLLNGHRVAQHAGWASHLSSSRVASLRAHATDRVIVLLRNQETGLRGRSQLSRRASALAQAQAPIVSQLTQLHAHSQGYHVVNAIATTVSKAEAANLASNPAVAAVVPNEIVHGPSTNSDLLGSSAATSANNRRPGPGQNPTSSPFNTNGLYVTNNQTCPAPGQPPLTAPEGLSLIHAYSSDPSQPSAQGLGYTGAGVSIAVFPTGIDPSLPDFQRSNGHGGTESAITDYQDFTGEGTSGINADAEGWGDVSTLISQGKTVYNLDQVVNPAFANSTSCDIRVLGVSPGADVDVMKVFGDNNDAFDSEILQGLDWAVYHDHVNILSESFGGDPIPNPADDPITLFNEQAAADGTTVVVSTGDAGPTNTEGEPANGKGVLGAAASTSYQTIAQADLYLYDLAGTIGHSTTQQPYTLGQPTPGWLDDEVSTLSSSGFTTNLRMPDIIAPGDENWIDCSPNLTAYPECATGLGGADNTGVTTFGGTSESAPMTAGVAALVIQAYREAHHGATPSSQVVNDIITSSATDIDVPGNEMGAGLLNALNAVKLAKAWGSASSSGGLTHTPTSVSQTGEPGSPQSQTISITNTSDKSETVTPQLRELGAPQVLSGGNMQMSASGGTSCEGISSAMYFTGETIKELNCTTFTVPSGTDQLDSRIAWNPNVACSTCTAGPPTVREFLVDPQGRYANYSDPQGDGSGFADAQVHNPLPGRWTLVILSRQSSAYTGAVNYAVTGASYHDVAGVFSPSSARVAPGASASFTANLTQPSAPGDTTGSIVFGPAGSTAAGSGTIPVALRTLVPVSSHSAGNFTGTLLGGNGRPNTFGAQLTYQFTVPAGVQDVNVNMTAGDDGYLLLGQLTDPNNNPVDTQFSYTTTDNAGDSGNTRTTSLTWHDPTPGTWTLTVANVLLPSNEIYSGKVAVPLNGTVSFNSVKDSISGLGALKPGSTVTANVRVTNNGVEPESYFVDPRLDSTATYDSPSATVSSGTLPITFADTFPQFLVPPLSSQLSVQTSTTGPRPIDFAISPAWGSPEYESSNSSGSTPASVTIPNPIASEWGFGPTEVGPFGANPAPSENYSSSASVATQAFDPNVSSSTGDAWADLMGQSNANYSPLFLQPGQSGTIQVTFTVPSSSSSSSGRDHTGGATGELYLETLNTNVFPDDNSDVLAAFPYQYGR